MSSQIWVCLAFVCSPLFYLVPCAAAAVAHPFRLSCLGKKGLCRKGNYTVLNSTIVWDLTP